MIQISDRTANRLTVAGRVLAVVVVVLLAVVGRTVGLPRNPEGDWFASVEVPVQLGLLAVVLVGVAVSLRWAAPAATAIALAGAGLSVVAAIAYPPSVALGLTVAFLAPAVLLWLGWQRRESLGRIAGLAVVTATVLAAVTFSATAVYDHFFGPAHPSSATPALDDPEIAWAWSGAVTGNGFTVVAETRDPDARSVEVSAVPVDDAPGAVELVEVSATVVDGVARAEVQGLDASTSYRYGFTVDGAASGWSGTVRTFPDATADEAVSDEIVIAVSSCARTGSNGQVYDAIREMSPDLYIISGDMHYSNISRDDVDAFRRAYDRVLTAPAQAALYRAVPTAYVWDDHDYSGNDGDAEAASRPAARAAYEVAAPHYPLESADTIHQAFSVGGVRVVLLDTRSARVPGVTLLGEDQGAWLEAELLASSPTHDLVIVVSPTPWIGAASASSDAWAGFADERAGISQFIADHDLDNLMIVGGDAHMVAIDDGTNSDYSATGGPKTPVLQAAALDRPGNVKGGPYSEGTFPGPGQFGTITVRRGGPTTTVVLEGRTYDGDVLSRYEFTVESADG